MPLSPLFYERLSNISCVLMAGLITYNTYTTIKYLRGEATRREQEWGLEQQRFNRLKQRRITPPLNESRKDA